MTNQLFAVLAPIFLAAFNRRISRAGFTSDVRGPTRSAVKSALLLFSVAVLLAGGAAAVRGQSALDGFDPNANAAVRVVVVQPDGKILIAGDFTALAPNGGAAVARSGLARLNPDGTLDTAFNPNASGEVLSIAVQPIDGKIVVGGVFGQIGGQTRHRLARLDATTGLADSFDPNPAGDVYAVAVQADGKILVGGTFNGANSIGGAARNNIARLDPVTGLADSFDPNAQGGVRSITVQADGKIVVGGSFIGPNSIGGQARNYIARLDPTTGLADAFDPYANNQVNSIAIQVDGKILAGGNFTFIGGQTRNYIARLDATTGLADAFDPNANDQVFSVAVQADGRILAGGLFNGTNSIGGQARNYIARLNEITGLADSFDPNPAGDVYAVAVQLDGKILAGGNFTSFSPDGGAAVTRNNIACLEKDGRLDRTLDLNMVGFGAVAIAVQPDGKFLIGGLFTSILGVARTNIARLNTDGTLDTAFNPNANGSVHSIVVQGDGQILVGGEFHGANSIGGAERNYIARLDGVTGVADSFNPKIDTNATFAVFSMTLQADGKILVCGTFTNIGGLSRSYLARLNPDGTLDAAFNPNPDSDVETVAVQFDGKILVGGNFTSIGGQPRNRIARLDATNGMADSFNPNADSSVGAIVVRNSFLQVADGGYTEIFVGGSFTNIGGATRNHIARLGSISGLADYYDPNADGLVLSILLLTDYKLLVGGQFSYIGGQPRNRIARLDGLVAAADSFDPNANYSVTSLALQPDGKILAEGLFNGTNSIGGQTRNYFARLSNDTHTQPMIYVDFSYFVVWTFEDHPFQQFTRVTFELSTNNVNYTFLGNALDLGGQWFLPDPSMTSAPPLNLPTGQNIYIRARGYYSSGYLNGSGSIVESVQNIFLPTPPPRLNIQLSANTNVVLSWATNFTVFTLESNTNLTTTNWIVVSPAPAVSGTNNVVTNAVSGSTRFYRLRQYQ